MSSDTKAAAAPTAAERRSKKRPKPDSPSQPERLAAASSASSSSSAAAVAAASSYASKTGSPSTSSAASASNVQKGSPTSAQPKKRSRRDKKKKERRSLLRVFKVNADLFEALKTKQADLGVDGADFLVGEVSANGNQLILNPSFYQSSGGEGSGLYEQYTLDEVHRADTYANALEKKRNEAAAAGDSKKKKKKKRQSCQIPIKMFTRDQTDRKVLVADIGTEYNVKIPADAKRKVKRVVKSQMNIVTTVSRDHLRSTKDTRIYTALVQNQPGPASTGPVIRRENRNDEQIQANLFRLFRQKGAWKATELGVELGLTTANIKRHLKAVGAYYHQSGELASMWTTDRRFEKKKR